MKALIPLLFFWILSLWGEVYLFQFLGLIKPNLFFVIPLIFGLRWRGVETFYIFLFFGLTADGFSSLPYGVYGLSYFICSFFIRWYGIKIFNGYLLIVPILAGFFTLVLSSMVYFIESFFFVQKVLTLKWIQSLILFEVLPTALIAVPLFQLLIMIDARLKLRLAERKF